MTLIELVMVIAVFAVAITPLLLLMSSLNQQVVQARLMNSAIILGQDKLEEILAINYDNIDKFSGVEEDNIEFYPGFSRKVCVCYADPDGGDIKPCFNSNDKCINGGSDKGYKRIDVRIKNRILEGYNIKSVRFTLIVSSEYPK